MHRKTLGSRKLRGPSSYTIVHTGEIIGVALRNARKRNLSSRGCIRIFRVRGRGVAKSCNSILDMLRGTIADILSERRWRDSIAPVVLYGSHLHHIRMGTTQMNGGLQVRVG